MFKILVLQVLYSLPDDQAEFQILDRRSFGRFLGLDDGDRVPDAKTIWLFRETLTRARAVQRLFDRFDAVLNERGYLAMRGQIADATVIEARWPRLTTKEKATIKGGGTPEHWSKAKRAQMDRDGRWTLKRGRKKPKPDGAARTAAEVVVPAFGDKNHIGVDRRFGLICTFPVTHAAAHDGGQLASLLDPNNLASGVWADTAYRSAANLNLLARPGLVPEFQRAKPKGKPRGKPRGKPMPAHVAPRQRKPRPHPRPCQARLCRPETPPGIGHPQRRPRSRQDQDHAGQHGLQHAPADLARRESCARITPADGRNRPLDRADPRKTNKSPSAKPSSAARHRNQPHNRRQLPLFEASSCLGS